MPPDAILKLRNTSSLNQLTFAEFIISGHYDRQVRRSRLAYQRRRDRLVYALRQHTPWVQITGIAAGLHLLLEHQTATPNTPSQGPSHDSPPYSRVCLTRRHLRPDPGLTDPDLRAGRAGGARGGRARYARRTRCGTGRSAAGWG
jgi:hypothetical protein